MAHTFVTHKNGVIVKTTLYGEVTSERLAKETREAQHRVEQLQPSRVAPERLARETRDVQRRRDVSEDWNDAWDGSYQSTGR